MIFTGFRSSGGFYAPIIISRRRTPIPSHQQPKGESEKEEKGAQLLPSLGCNGFLAWLHWSIVGLVLESEAAAEERAWLMIRPLPGCCQFRFFAIV
jgi:hypothetical protein